MKVVETLLCKGAEIDVEDEDHCTPLTLAVERRHNSILLYLIDHGADVKKKDGHKRTALHYASERGGLKVVETLLSKSAEIDVEDEDRCRPLMLAAERRHINILLCLINYGDDVDKRDDCKQTALHHASERGDLEMVQALLSKGAETDVGDKDHCTPLISAVKNQKFAIMCHLIKAGANVKCLVDYFSDSGKGSYFGRGPRLRSLSYAIVHCECVLLYCSKYCTSYSILPGTTAPHPTQVFDCEAFMDKFKERLLQSVNSRAIVLRLEIENVISEDLAFAIERHCSRSTGNERLFLYLRRQAAPGSIRKLCDVMM